MEALLYFIFFALFAVDVIFVLAANYFPLFLYLAAVIGIAWQKKK